MKSGRKTCPNLFEVQNALEDQRFYDNPLVTDEPNVQFYAGAVLKDLKGHNLGTLCVIDHEPKKLTSFQKDSLTTLASQVVTQLELRRHLKMYEQALKHEEKLNKSQLRFFASIGHEIRTPLNGVLGMAQVLKDEVHSTEQKEYVDIIENCGKDLLRILNDILDLSKIEAGKVELEHISFDLVKASQDVMQLFQANADEKNNELNLIVSSSLPNLVKGDPLRVKQILINLISNAVKYTKDGLIQVSISYSNDKKVILSVEDNGVGIEKDIVKNLFDPFQQARLSDYRKYGGTGLGLSIIKMLTEIMNGEVTLDSEEGKGTKVIVKLPLKGL